MTLYTEEPDKTVGIIACFGFQFRKRIMTFYVLYRDIRWNDFFFLNVISILLIINKKRNTLNTYFRKILFEFDIRQR